MARFLAIDLDQRQLRLASVNAGRGSAVIEQVFSHAFPEDLTPTSGEALGRGLRDLLKQQGVAVAPVLACVGRDRVILKEVRYPAVPVHEEPALVRFQASKELTEPASEVVIDYQVLSDPKAPGPRLAMAIIVRRDVVQTIAALARGLGVKVLGVAPRPLALAAALERAHGASAGQEQAAVLNNSERWAELCIFQNSKPRFARSLLTGPTLMQDVRRSLALHAAQAGEGDLPQTLHLGGRPTPEALEAWRSAIGLKVAPLDPFLPKDKDVPAAERYAYLGVAGLAQLAISFPNWPVNFSRPKEGGPTPHQEGRRQKMVWGAIVTAALVGLLVIGIIFVALRQGELATLKDEEANLDARIKELSQDKPTVDALKDWNSGAVSWLDEIHDVAASFPHEKGLRITQLSAVALPRKAPTDKFAGRVIVHGVVPAGKSKLVDAFVDAMMNSPRGDVKAKGKGKTALVQVKRERYKEGETQDEFQIRIDVAHLTPLEFHAALPPPPKTFGKFKFGPPPSTPKEEDPAEEWEVEP